MSDRQTGPSLTFPLINWEEFELLEADPDERMETFRCEGTDEYGNEYIGTAIYHDHEFDQINDIELS